MVHIPGVKNKAPDTLSRHPTGDRQPAKMVLRDDVHSIQSYPTVSPLFIPTILMAGVCVDEEAHTMDMGEQIRGLLASALHSTHIVDWDQVQTATASDEDMFLRARARARARAILSTIEQGYPLYH